MFADVQTLSATKDGDEKQSQKHSLRTVINNFTLISTQTHSVVLSKRKQEVTRRTVNIIHWLHSMTHSTKYNRRTNALHILPFLPRAEESQMTKKREERRTRGRRRRKTGGGISPGLSKVSEQRSYTERTNRIKTGREREQRRKQCRGEIQH